MTTAIALDAFDWPPLQTNPARIANCYTAPESSDSELNTGALTELTGGLAMRSKVDMVTMRALRHVAYISAPTRFKRQSCALPCHSDLVTEWSVAAQEHGVTAVLHHKLTAPRYQGCTKSFHNLKQNLFENADIQSANLCAERSNWTTLTTWYWISSPKMKWMLEPMPGCHPPLHGGVEHAVGIECRPPGLVIELPQVRTSGLVMELA